MSKKLSFVFYIKMYIFWIITLASLNWINCELFNLNILHNNDLNSYFNGVYKDDKFCLPAENVNISTDCEGGVARTVTMVCNAVTCLILVRFGIYVIVLKLA